MDTGTEDHWGRTASTAQVQDIYDRLKNAGVGIKFALQKAGSNFAFQCYAPDFISVEVSAPLWNQSLNEKHPGGFNLYLNNAGQ
jgi:hypothetical protein